jgi:hypothetical protein
MKRLWMQLWDMQGIWPFPLLWITLPAAAGVLFGYFSASGAGTSAHLAIRETMTAYVSRTGVPRTDLWIVIGIVVAAALLIFISGKTAIGLLAVPIAVLLHGYLLSFTLSAALIVFGGSMTLWNALWRMGVIFVPMCVLEWPALLMLSAQSTGWSRARFLRGAVTPMRWESCLRAVLCTLSLCLAAVLRVLLTPWMLSAALTSAP